LRYAIKRWGLTPPATANPSGRGSLAIADPSNRHISAPAGPVSQNVHNQSRQPGYHSLPTEWMRTSAIGVSATMAAAFRNEPMQMYCPDCQNTEIQFTEPSLGNTPTPTRPYRTCNILLLVHTTDMYITAHTRVTSTCIQITVRQITWSKRRPTMTMIELTIDAQPVVGLNAGSVELDEASVSCSHNMCHCLSSFSTFRVYRIYRMHVIPQLAVSMGQHGLS